MFELCRGREIIGSDNDFRIPARDPGLADAGAPSRGLRSTRGVWRADNFFLWVPRKWRKFAVVGPPASNTHSRAIQGSGAQM